MPSASRPIHAAMLALHALCQLLFSLICEAESMYEEAAEDFEAD